MTKRLYVLLILCAVLSGTPISAITSEDIADLSSADRFALKVLDPSMEFIWRSHRIRQKILSRLGIPDEMELRTEPERTADFYWAREEWNYIGGPKLILYSNDNEWIESISIPTNSQITLALDLYVGAPRSEFVEKLELGEKAKTESGPIGYQSDLRTPFGPVSIRVAIEFDDNGDSTRVTWHASE